MTDPDRHVRRLAAESLATGDPTGWFERLYAEAEGGSAEVPWDRGGPHRLLLDWAQQRRLAGHGRRAVIVGCGFGADAEFVASLGFETVGFDVSATAIRAARRRFPDSTVSYRAADLLDLPGEWHHAFDLVVESMTVQSMPVTTRARASAAVSDLVAPGGTLLVIAFGTDQRDGSLPGPPWPLTRAEIDAFAANGLRPVRVEDIRDGGDPASRRWRAEFRSGSQPGAGV